MRNLIFILALTISIPAHADNHGHSLGAHEHGSVALELGVDGKSLEIDLDGPAESFLGFEHAPKSKKEKELFASTERLWNKNLFSIISFDQKLDCKVTHSDFKQEIELEKDQKSNKHEKEAGTHSVIEAKAKILCNRDLNAQNVKISLRKIFPNIKKLKVDIVGLTTKTHNITKPIEEITL